MPHDVPSASVVRAQLRGAHGLSTLTDTSRATNQACAQVLAKLGGPPDLLFVFMTPQHIDQTNVLTAIIQDQLAPREYVGMSGISVIAGPHEIERGAGISLLALQLPGVRVTTFTSDTLPDLVGDSPDPQLWAESIDAHEDLRGVFLFLDPFSVPMTALMPALNGAVDHAWDLARAKKQQAIRPLLVGGVASAASKPGGNVLMATNRVRRSGVVGVSLSGPIHIDNVISQGCRPIGPLLVVTKAKANLIMELSGKPAATAIQEAIEALGDNPREVLLGGLFVGVVIDEYKARFGRGDFLIRNIVGVDPDRGYVAVADFVRVGQTVRLHTRDAKTASEDLSLLLDAQKLYDPPAASLLISCNERGERLFGQRDHDARTVVQAFLPRTPGEDVSIGGAVIDPSRAEAIPQAGVFAAGEIGPIGNEVFLHAQTACAALFRPE